MAENGKEFQYRADENRYQCLVCNSFLSSKRRVENHLHSTHGYSPVKRRKKLYLNDPTAPIPDRTLRRWKHRHVNVDYNDSVRPEQSTSDDIVTDECSSPSMHSTEVNFPVNTNLPKDHTDIISNIGSQSVDSSPLQNKCIEQDCDSNSESNSDDTCSVTSFSDDSSDMSSSEISSAEDNIESTNYQNSSQFILANHLQALTILACFLSNKLSASVSNSILSMMQSLFPENISLKGMNYDALLKLTGNNNFKEINYCVICNEVFPDDEDQFLCLTMNCEGLRYKGSMENQAHKGRRPRQSFVIADAEKQLAALLTRKDVDDTMEYHAFANGKQPFPQWMPQFCVLQQDTKVFTCFESEKQADDEGRISRISKVRLDGNKQEFDKRWGYETLASIKENAIQHSPTVSTESFFKGHLVNAKNNSYQDSSYEKVTPPERRGSVPLVPAAVEEDAMEHISTPSRLASFFIRKGFRSNLKRTKSVTKLDRKRSASNVSENETKEPGALKRTMSLGRLNRKKNKTIQAKSPHEHALSLISSRIRTSRSHESLLTSQATMHAIDLTAQDVEIKPLHSSILQQDHCLQVSTSNGNKYISCRTADEREKWIESLRKTVHPNQEQSRRTDNSLKLWIVEGKNVPSKKRYFCEICLDRTVYARTCSKTKNDMLFWGESFEFNKLPEVDMITVNLYREADKKKKKDKNVALGYINIPISDISSRQLVEKWYTANSGTVGRNGKENKNETPILRVKARYHTVQILPMDLYQEFISYLTSDYCKLCEVLEPLVSVRDKEEIATSLVHIMQKVNKAQDFLSDIVIAEISKLDNQHLTFRGNTLATKAMEAYMKLVGEQYLQDTLGEFVKNLIESPDDCEVDPTKVASNATLQRHQTNLIMYCEMAWVKIIQSYCYFPNELREVFTSFRRRCEAQQKEELSDHLISASIFLRFLCPAILSPSLFHLTQEYPPEKASRNLTMIAKTIQTLTNFMKFGGKEEFMIFMNDFVERESVSMRTFFKHISTTSDSENQFLGFDGYIDLGKELSMLHSLLSECVDRAPDSVLLKLGPLGSILERIDDAIKDPQAGRRQATRSQVYDNLPSPTSGTLPTEALREMLRQCGDSGDLLDFNKNSRQGSFDVGSSRRAAGSLRTNDDYVLVSALQKDSQSQVGNVSVQVRRTQNEECVNQKWSKMVSAASMRNGGVGDYDLIRFIDDVGEDRHNSSIEMDDNMHGSQVSIGGISGNASSGYQSFVYSQSSSPVEPGGQQQQLASLQDHRMIVKSPSLQMPPTVQQPLSFSNPLYKHQLNSSRGPTPSPIRPASSTSSLSSGDETVTVKKCSLRQNDPLRNIAPQISSSSSSESLNNEPSLNERPQCSNSSQLTASARGLTLNLCGSNTIHAHSSPKPNHRASCHNGQSQQFVSASLKQSELSHSVDFAYMRQKYGDQIRRAATDTVISQNNGAYDTNSATLPATSPTDPAHNGSRRLSPLNAVHMGIRSVQRKIISQEKTKQEYDAEVAVLRQQLQDSQSRLQEAESRLHIHESDTQEIIVEWQKRLEESEERMRQQQVEKDDQMKGIMQRLIAVEGDLQQEQVDLQHVVSSKQKVIEGQERKIQNLDTANVRLISSLNHLKERYIDNTQTTNGLHNSIRTKFGNSDSYKSSFC